MRRLLADLPHATYLLALAQALNLTCAVISVTIAAIVGSQLAATPALSTIPYGVQFASVMLCTYPASMLMRHHGRRVVFSCGAVMLIIAGILGYKAVVTEDFAWLIASHAALGLYISCANFYRFAAVDNMESATKARALSLVIAGGVLAAIVGPAIANTLRVVPGFADFSLCYAAFSLLGIATLLLMALWHPQEANFATQPPVHIQSQHASIQISPSVLVAIFCSASGYFMMNLLMVQASLVMKEICSFSATSLAIEVHVLCMFAPSFLTGSIITRIGLQKTLIAGFLLIGSAMSLGMLEVRYAFVFTALALLGLGWNFTYVGGGALLVQSVDEHDRHRWQGINDTVIATCATLGAFLPAPMLSGLGWNGSNLALAPICLLGVVLCASVLARTEVWHPQAVMNDSEK